MFNLKFFYDILTFNRNRPIDRPRTYECTCNGTSKSSGLYEYHFVECKVDGNGIILHDTVVHTLVWLFRGTSGLSVSLEPLRLFSEVNPDDNRRANILLRNPHGGGRQVIIEVAVTGVDRYSRHLHDNPL